MKKKHILRRFLAFTLAASALGGLSSCADMWMSTSTGLDFPGGIGVDIGLGGPIGHHYGPLPGRPHPLPPGPPPLGTNGFGAPIRPIGPPPGGPFWGPF